MASFSFSVPYQFAFTQLALFGTGAFLMRGAGCTINDLWDRKLDAQVERTLARPLASGKLRVGQAIGFLGVQLAGAAAVLAQLNWYRYVSTAYRLGKEGLWYGLKPGVAVFCSAQRPSQS
jgi:4-hydroxybenzoate polyprenyltransferase